MTYKELITKFGFEVNEAPLEKVEKRLEGIKHALEFLAAAEVIKGIFELTERFSKFAEGLHIAAESAGLTVEEFQKLSFAAKQSAVSQEELSGAMARLSRNVYNARKGSAEAQDVFMRAGFSVQQIQGFKTGSDALLALSDRFKSIQDPIQKQAIAMTLLGRGSVNMVGFLSQGSAAIRGLGVEAEGLGAILTHHQVEALVKAEHALGKFKTVMETLGATIAAYFSPAIESAVNSFLKFYKANKSLIEVNVKEWVWDITFAMGFVYEAVKTVAQAFLDFSKQHPLLTRRVIEFGLGLAGIVGTIWTIQKIISVLTGSVTLLTVAFEAFGTVFTLLTSPVGLIVGGLVLLVATVHDLWLELTEPKNLQDLWLLKAFNKVSGIGSMLFKGLFGVGGEDGQSAGGVQAFQNIANAPNMNIPVGAVNSASNGSQYSLNAPITVNVGSNLGSKEAAKAVQTGIADHLDRTKRELGRGLKSGVQY